MSGVSDLVHLGPQSELLFPQLFLPNPASPCHASLAEAAKWASHVPPEQRARWVAPAQQPSQTVYLKMCDLVFLALCPVFPCVSARRSLPLRLSPTPDAWTPAPLPDAPLDPTGNCPSCARRRRPKWKVLTHICPTTLFPFDCNVDLIFIFCI